jgi:DNA-binding response OmpR family regulator
MPEAGRGDAGSWDDADPDTRTVLVVEDEQPLADLYATWLREHYEVRTANSGADALDLLDAAVDVVLLDRRLPDVTGTEVLEAIRASDPDYQVAMVTAVEPDTDVLEMGFDDYLTKPVRDSDLQCVVESLVSRQDYGECVQQYFRLLSKRAALQRELDGDLAAHSEYDGLREDIEALEAELGDIVADFSATDFDAQFHWFSKTAASADD